MKDAKGHGSAGKGKSIWDQGVKKIWGGQRPVSPDITGTRSNWTHERPPSQAIADGHPKTAPVDTHPAWQHDAPQYHATVSAKNGRTLGKYGPNPDRDAVIKEAFEKHPRAKSVSSMRGHGMDMRWHNR